MGRLLDRMSERSRAQLLEDVEDFGHLAEHGYRRVMELAGIGQKRARRLCEWMSAATPAAQRAPSAPLPPRRALPVHLVIPDAHTHPHQDMRRLSWLGRLIEDIDPDVVVCLGDWADYVSLCSHVPPHRRSTTIEQDADASETGIAIMESACPQWIAKARAGLRRRVACGGNHDWARPVRFMQDNPNTLGSIPIMPGFEARGWEVYAYREPVRIDGIRYQHDLESKAGRALSGVNHARNMLARLKHRESITVGHSHLLQGYTIKPHLGPRVRALAAGWYAEHREEYAGEDNHEWWSGVIVKRHVSGGDYAREEWPIDRVRHCYGGGVS